MEKMTKSDLEELLQNLTQFNEQLKNASKEMEIAFEKYKKSHGLAIPKEEFNYEAKEKPTTEKDGSNLPLYII